MKLIYEDNKIIMEDKEITDLDKFVLNFKSLLEKYAEYVIVSGYVIILFGRSRLTEDIDIIVRHTDKNTTTSLYNALIKGGYDLLNAGGPDDMYEMLEEGLGIRIVKKDMVIPNIDFKFVKDRFGRYSIDNRLEVIMGENHLYISPIELQIPYKLYLGSDKDIEDAIYLWKIFKENIDLDTMGEFMKDLDADPEMVKLLLES